MNALSLYGKWAVVVLFFGALVSPLQGNEPHPVRARLIAEVDGVAPGARFRVGVELRMDEEWHTYWQFGGDAGVPTLVEWELPAGFVAGPLQWPLPRRYEELGELITYGYSTETLLFAQLVAPAGIRVGETLRLGARVSWLACREICIPGDTLLALELPVVLQDEIQEIEGERFAHYASRVPGPLDEAMPLDYQVRRVGRQLRVEVVLRRPDLEVGEELPDFYPLAAENFEFRSSLVARDPPTLELQLQPYGETSIEVLQGVLVYRVAGEAARRGGLVELALTAAGDPVALLAQDFSDLGDEGEGRSLITYLLLAVLGGLLLNLMPCVLPVILLKILGFVSQAGEERRRVRLLGISFAGGMVFAFVALAGVVVLLKRGGEQIGWGFQFQHPGFIMAMTALVFAFGLSLFGVFTVNLSGGGLSGLAAREGLGGSFFNGMLATILATPCTAPLLGTALGFAFSQSAGVIWGIFTAIGLGMALPYMLLALQPDWGRWLPKPGVWMEHFKHLMGFLLMGIVLWLLWVLGKQVGVEGVIWTGAFLLCVSLACWLVGQWVDLRSGRLKRRFAWALALAAIVVGYRVFLAPVLAVEQQLADAGPDQRHGVVWTPFSVAEVERLLAAGERHVFINFTAEWCLVCKVNERTVLRRDAVLERFAQQDVSLVKADWTNRNPEITQLLSRFGRSGVPFYVIFPAGRPDRPLVLPERIDPGIILEKLEEAEVLSRPTAW